MEQKLVRLHGAKRTQSRAKCFRELSPALGFETLVLLYNVEPRREHCVQQASSTTHYNMFDKEIFIKFLAQ